MCTYTFSEIPIGTIFISDKILYTKTGAKTGVRTFIKEFGYVRKSFTETDLVEKVQRLSVKGTNGTRIYQK